MEINKIDLDQTGTRSPLVESPSTQPGSPVVKFKNVMLDKKLLPTAVMFAVVIGLGLITGSWLKTRAAGGNAEKGTIGVQAEIPVNGVKVGDTYGSTDERAFRDKVLGVVDKSGLNGEGTHKLLRPGGASQTVCLSSTTIDLDQLVGHQVTLWGETFDGQKCGWLMDVGRAKIENLNVPLPLPTRIVMGFARFVSTFWPIIILAGGTKHGQSKDIKKAP